jgi:hypothetical protein
MTKNNKLAHMTGSLFFLLLVLTGTAVAQAVFGNMTGTVTDPSGAPIPDLVVSIQDLERGISYESKTNASGNFTQTHLISGRYQVHLAAPGFAEFTTEAVVQIDSTARVDIQLQLGTTESRVIVNVDASIMKTERADVSTTLTSQEIGKLPILDRNLFNLMIALPGTARPNTVGAVSLAEDQQGDPQLQVNGQQGYSNGFLLDGTENHSNTLGIAVVNPNPDTLEEFKFTTSNYDAEFGNVSGALLQATTKSGTNSLHGSAYEYFRNDIMNAADPFSGINPPIRWNQFGGTLGGPIKKDKLFAFFSYEGRRLRTSGSQVATVPTDKERSGDLSGFLGAFICSDGSTSASGCAAGNQLTVSTTEGAQVPAQAGMVFDPSTGNADGTNRQVFSTGGKLNVLTPSPAMTKLLGSLPEPNANAGADFNNYVTAVGAQSNSNLWSGRVDYVLAANHHLFGRYSLSDFKLHAPGAYGEIAGGPTPNGFAGNSLARNQSLALGYTYVLSQTLFTEFRFGFYRVRTNNTPNGADQTPALDAGLQGLNRGTPDTGGMPAFFVKGTDAFNFGYALGVNGCNCLLGETENQFQSVNNWTKLYGNHTIKWGVDIRRAQQKRIDSSTHRAGEISFSDSTTGSATVDAIANGNATTGAALASYLLGQPSNFNQQFTGSGFYPSLRQTRLYFFGQDEWRISHKLLFTYGLRYENYLPQTGTKPGSAGTFDPATGEVLVAGIGSVPSNMGIKPYNLGFAPRLGLTYQLFSKTVVRAGYGRGFNGAGYGAVFAQNPELDPPVQFVHNLTSPNQYITAVPTFLTSGPAPPANPPIGTTGRYPLPDGVSVFFYFDTPGSYRIPLADFWNLTVQHQIQPSFTVEAAYVGNVGRHLYLNRNENQAVPGPGTDFNLRRPFHKFGLSQAVYDVCNCDNSSYHSLQLKAQKRVSRGMDFLATYTWSKALSNGEGGYNFSDNYNVRNDHGPASFDRTHAFTLIHNWELPFGKGRRYLAKTNKAVDMVAGGWRLSGITTIYSGLALTPVLSNAPLVNADFNYFRPDITGDPHVSHPNAALWFNPAAYIQPQAPFRNGNAGKGTLRGPRLTVFNLSLAKEFLITESKTLELRWENFNAFNHVNLGLPAGGGVNSGVFADTSNAGQITSTSNPMRQMQLGLHFRF